MPSKAAPGHYVSVLAAGEVSAVVHVGPPPTHLRPSIFRKGQLPPEQVRAGDEQSSSSLAGEGCEGAIPLLPVEESHPLQAFEGESQKGKHC